MLAHDGLEDVLSGEGEGQGLDSAVIAIAPDGWRIAGNLCIAVLACGTLQPLRGFTYCPRDVRGGLVGSHDLSSPSSELVWALASSWLGEGESVSQKRILNIL